MNATVDEIRSHFPALQRNHRGHRVAYFDGPGGTQVPRQVARAMTAYLFEHNANTHWAYPSSSETDAIIYESRRAAADFLNCDPSEVAFGQNMTTLTFHLARALGRRWKAGDEVIVTELDHHANVAPWRALEIDKGIVVKAARLNLDTYTVDFEHMRSLVTDRTKLIAVNGASNALGTITDVAQARAIAREARALLFVDAVHLAAHEQIDVKAIDCDFLACSSYKFYGPHMGMLYGRSALLQSLPFPKLDPSPDTAPERVETGTQNHEGIAGIGATIDYLATLGDLGTRRERLASFFKEVHERGTRQARILYEGLASIAGVQVYGPKPGQPRTPTVSFTMDDRSAEEIVAVLVDQGIFASHGDFYAATVIERLGVEAVVRIGCACYTTDDEVERVIAAVRLLSPGS